MFKIKTIKVEKEIDPNELIESLEKVKYYYGWIIHKMDKYKSSNDILKNHSKEDYINTLQNDIDIIDKWIMGSHSKINDIIDKLR